MRSVFAEAVCVVAMMSVSVSCKYDFDASNEVTAINNLPTALSQAQTLDNQLNAIDVQIQEDAEALEQDIEAFDEDLAAAEDAAGLQAVFNDGLSIINDARTLVNDGSVLIDTINVFANVLNSTVDLFVCGDATQQIADLAADASLAQGDATELIDLADENLVDLLEVLDDAIAAAEDFGAPNFVNAITAEQATVQGLIDNLDALLAEDTGPLPLAEEAFATAEEELDILLADCP